MSRTTGTECWIEGGEITCPAGGRLQFDNESSTMLANLSCPLDSVRQSSLVQASSQEGVCTCEAALIPDGGDANPQEPIQCDCHACPDGSRFGFAYSCNEAIVGQCSIFNCAGICNGDMSSGLDGATFAPTATQTFLAGNTSTAGTECWIEGDYHICPADASFQFSGGKSNLLANVTCPLDSVRESSFVATSQEGLCTCEAALIPEGGDPNAPEPIQCDCYPCPEGSSLGFAYSCNKAIMGPCTIFNCVGICNGDMELQLDRETYVPTAAPTFSAGNTSTAADTGCRSEGDYSICPASRRFHFAGENSTLLANLTCAFDDARRSLLVEQTPQEGLCTCEAALIPDGGDANTPEPVQCECYACPEGSSFGFAYSCDKAIVGPCTTFNCAGICNGDLNFGLEGETNAPTATPTVSAVNNISAKTFSAGNTVSAAAVTMALIVLPLARMFR